MTITQKFGAAVRSARKKKGLSQEKLAKMVGIQQSYLSRIECGTYNDSITNDLAEKIAEKLECSIYVLLK